MQFWNKREEMGMGINIKKRGYGAKFLSSELAGLFIALAIMLAVFWIKIPNFFRSANYLNILTSAVTMGLVAIGQSYLIIAGQIDLSSGAVAAFCGVLAAILLRAGWNPWMAVAVTMAAGMLFGLINAMLVNEMKFQAFIATYATQSIARGLAYIINGSKSVAITNETFVNIGKGSAFGISYPVWILIVALVLSALFLKYSRFGRSVYAIGGNPVASRLAGIHSQRVLTKLFVLSAAFSALGGILLAARMNSGIGSANTGLEFEGITAAILGGISFTGGSGGMIGTILGIFILQGFTNGLLIMNVETFWQYVARGALLIFALAFDSIRQRLRDR